MPRRLSVAVSGLSTVAFAMTAGLLLGPRIEARFWPIRVDQAINDVQRDARMVRFTLVSNKLRISELDGLTVFLFSPSDRFAVTLYKELSPSDEPCTEILPVARSQRVGVGPHSSRYCIEIPRTVNVTDGLKISIVSHYRGFAGLWDLPQAMPDVDVPGDSVQTSETSEPMAAWGD